MKKMQTKIALNLSSALALSLAGGISQAAENPFTATSLSQGYQVADNSSKNAATTKKLHGGVCGAAKAKEGQCASEKTKASSADKSKATSSDSSKMKEGACSAEKMQEGACSAEMMQSLKKTKK